MIDGNSLDRSPLRPQAAAPRARLHRGGGGRARTGHRRQHRDLLHRGRRAVASAALYRPRPRGDGLGGELRRQFSPQYARARKLRGLEEAQPRLQRHGRHEGRLGQPDRRRPPRTGGGTRRDGQFLRRPRRQAGRRPHLHRRRRPHRRARRRHQLCALAAPLCRRPGRGEPRNPDQRPEVHHHRRHAARFRLPQPQDGFLDPDSLRALRPGQPRLALPQRGGAAQAGRIARPGPRGHERHRRPTGRGVSRRRPQNRRRGGSDARRNRRQYAHRTPGADGCGGMCPPDRLREPRGTAAGTRPRTAARNGGALGARRQPRPPGHADDRRRRPDRTRPADCSACCSPRRV